ncbi:MAG: hypothetical protein OXC93_14510 [Rhodospirillaceae bacterium]|nr:hypothetical protein [Rhodospirillaceae bacterium]
MSGSLRADRLAPHGLAAQHPHAFIVELFEAEADALLDAVCGPHAARAIAKRSTPAG